MFVCFWRLCEFFQAQLIPPLFRICLHDCSGQHHSVSILLPIKRHRIELLSGEADPERRAVPPRLPLERPKSITFPVISAPQVLATEIPFPKTTYSGACKGLYSSTCCSYHSGISKDPLREIIDDHCRANTLRNGKECIAYQYLPFYSSVHPPITCGGRG